MKYKEEENKDDVDEDKEDDKEDYDENKEENQKKQSERLLQIYDKTPLRSTALS